MARLKIIKVYSANKPNKVMEGEMKDGEDCIGAYLRIIRENKVRNVGTFIVLHYVGDSVGDGAYVTEYHDGVQFGRGSTVWLNRDVINEICRCKQ